MVRPKIFVPAAVVLGALGVGGLVLYTPNHSACSSILIQATNESLCRTANTFYIISWVLIAIAILMTLGQIASLTQSRNSTSTGQSPNQEFCVSCGKPMAINSAFCPQCGATAAPTNSSVVVETPQDNKGPSESELAVSLEKSEDEKSIGRRRSAWNHPVAIGLIVIALILASGAVAVAINDHHDPTVTSSSTSQTTIRPSGLVSANLPLSSCTTTYGIPGTKPARLPNYIREMIPRGDVGKLKVFADAQGVMELVGPRQWGCDASIGADGSSSLFIGPIGTNNYSGKLASSSTVEQISGSQTSACVSCGLDQACPLFAAAAQENQSDYQQGCLTSAPASESITQLTKSVVEFTDPPGVHGDANPSGGAYAARGAMTFSSGQLVTSWMETCLLPPSEQSLCSASLDDFVSAYGSK